MGLPMVPERPWVGILMILACPTAQSCLADRSVCRRRSRTTLRSHVCKPRDRPDPEFASWQPLQCSQTYQLGRPISRASWHMHNPLLSRRRGFPATTSWSLFDSGSQRQEQSIRNSVPKSHLEAALKSMFGGLQSPFLGPPEVHPWGLLEVYLSH